MKLRAFATNTKYCDYFVIESEVELHPFQHNIHIPYNSMLNLYSLIKVYPNLLFTWNTKLYLINNEMYFISERNLKYSVRKEGDIYKFNDAWWLEGETASVVELDAEELSLLIFGVGAELSKNLGNVSAQLKDLGLHLIK
jgi:hypothetical protein